MRVLVTGTSRHLGEGLASVLRARGDEIVGLNLLPSPWTSIVGSAADRDCVRRCMQGVDAVVHSATLHKPHVGSHDRQTFIDTNVVGTLHLLEQAVAAGVTRFVFKSTTSTFGHALVPAAGQPAAWITERVVPMVKNIYGATKVAAEDLCELVHRETGLPVLVLRTSRCFRERDDRADVRLAFDADNLKVCELLHRRVDLEDAVAAHLLALERAEALGFGRYFVSATSPFTPGDLAELRTDAPTVVARRVPGFEAAFAARGWRMVPSVDRVYVNEDARRDLGWVPRHDFPAVIERLGRGGSWSSDLAAAVGAKGYHAQPTGVYTTR